MHREWGLRSTARVDGFWSRSMFIYSFHGLSYTGIRNPLKFIIHITSSLRSQIRFIPRCSGPVLDLLNPTVALPYYRV